MKKLLYLIFAVILVACDKDNEITYRVDSEVTPYVDAFYKAGSEHNVTLERNLITKPTGSDTYGARQDGQNYLYYQNTISATKDVEGLREIAIYDNLASLLYKTPQPAFQFTKEDLKELTDARRQQMFDYLFSK